MRRSETGTVRNMINPMLALCIVLAVGYAIRLRRTSRSKLAEAERLHTEAVGVCVSLTGELDELTARLAARDHELSAFYAEEERRVERERAVSGGWNARLN